MISIGYCPLKRILLKTHAGYYYRVVLLIEVITPHAQRERGKVIGRGVHRYIYLWSKKKFESYFRDRLTFSNVDSRTSR